MSSETNQDAHYGTVTCTSTPEFDHITAFYRYDVTDISRGGYQIIDDTGEKVWYGSMNFEIPSMVG
jgi:hypothetical protein